MIPRTDLPQRRTAAPVAMPEGFVPPYDSIEPRFGKGRDHVMFALIGLENRGGDAAETRARLIAGFSGAHAPEVLEHGRVKKGYGPDAEIWFAYWRTRQDYDIWAERADVASLWNDDSLLTGPIGLWREAGVISLDHNETSFSSIETPTGLIHLSDGVGITDIHAYWGSARDRMVAAADDPLAAEDAATMPAVGLGRRTRVVAGGNSCFIRTSQDINVANQEQQDIYASKVKLTLMAGLDFLRANGDEAGCIGIRFIEECDDAGTFLGRTCGAGFFDSLASLERWTHSHPTHHAIMGSFMGMVERFQGNPGLQLWHEVTVFPAGTLVGDYINCSTDGSLMRA